RRREQGAAGVAAAEPGDVAEPAAPPQLRRGVPLRAPADRPAQEAAGPAGHREADPPPRGVPGAPARPPAGVHLVGAVRGQPAAPGGQPQPAEYARSATRRPGAARRAGPLRAVRATHGGAVLRAEEARVVRLHARVVGLRRTDVPVALER